MIGQGKTEELGEKPVPEPLCAPQTLHVLVRRRVPQKSNAVIVRSRRKLSTLACTMNCRKLSEVELGTA